MDILVWKSQLSQTSCLFSITIRSSPAWKPHFCDPGHPRLPEHKLRFCASSELPAKSSPAAVHSGKCPQRLALINSPCGSCGCKGGLPDRKVQPPLFKGASHWHPLHLHRVSVATEGTHLKQCRDSPWSSPGAYAQERRNGSCSLLPWGPAEPLTTQHATLDSRFLR